MKALFEQHAIIGQPGHMFSRLQMGEIKVHHIGESYVHSATLSVAPIVHAEAVEPVSLGIRSGTPAYEYAQRKKTVYMTQDRAEVLNRDHRVQQNFGFLGVAALYRKPNQAAGRQISL